MIRLKLRLIVRILVFIATTGFTSVSTATPYACVGTVASATVDPSGSVVASFSFATPSAGAMSWELMCSVTTLTNNVPVDACKGLVSVLLSAFHTKATVYVWFDNSTPNVCSMPAWGNLKSFGWYWGPALSS